VRNAGWALAAAVLALAGCSQVVPGTPRAAPPTVPVTAAPPSPGPAPSGGRSGLEADAVDDECLLNASEIGALVGTAVGPPAEQEVDRGGGNRGSSCVATADSEPVALVNVYRTLSGTPAEYVRAGGTAGRRVLDGVGEAAVVVETDAGPTLQLAGTEYLVTVLVAGRSPSEEAWRTAATAALSRLPDS
jgi:hypothetical protein